MEINTNLVWRSALFISLFFISGFLNNLFFIYTPIWRPFIDSLSIIRPILIVALIVKSRFKEYKYFKLVYLGAIPVILVELIALLEQFGVSMELDPMMYLLFRFSGVALIFIVFSSYLFNVLKFKVLLSVRFWFAFFELLVAVLGFYALSRHISIVQLRWMELYAFILLIGVMIISRKRKIG